MIETRPIGSAVTDRRRRFVVFIVQKRYAEGRDADEVRERFERRGLDVRRVEELNLDPEDAPPSGTG